LQKIALKFQHEKQEFQYKTIYNPAMISRNGLLTQLSDALSFWRGVVLLGPRQVGKTTLARQFSSVNSPNYFDLENPRSRDRLLDPMQALENLHGLVVIDEVQLAPHLFPVLRVLMDRSNEPGQYLLLGSAAPALLRQSNESLLGRVCTIEVTGFNIDDTAPADHAKLWLRGGYPLSFTAPSDAKSMAWRDSAVHSYLYTDLPQLGLNIDATAMLRFWKMLAHYHGQLWNAAAPARSLGVSETTVRRYLDQLTQTFMVRQLQPWHSNLGKRQVKSPKIYFRDTGLLHALMGIHRLDQLRTHPACGASWEGFALEQVIRLAQPDEAYFWATHAGAELDLLLLKGAQRVGVEFKHSSNPKVTQSMRIAANDLKLDRLYVVYPGDYRYALGNGIEAVPLAALL
jgi:uncharacterized protein